MSGWGGPLVAARARFTPLLALAWAMALPSSAEAQFCASVRPEVQLSVTGSIGPAAPAPTCLSAFYCEKPELSPPSLTVEFVPDPSDPTRRGRYRIVAIFPFVAEGNNQNDGTGGTTTDFRIKFHVFGDEAPPVPDCFPGFNDCDPIGTCGIPGASVPYDQGEVRVEITAGCDAFGTRPGQISGVSLSALRCATPAGTCNTRTDSAPITLPDLRDLGLLCPPEPNCCDLRCNDCKEGVNLGAGAGAYCPLDRSTGRGARLAWAGGGPGSEAAPGGADWRTRLGRGWSHDYAERIVESPDDTHVWLITKSGNFREFWSPVGGVYQGRAPADEYRTLTRTAGGWELRDLEGTVQSFGADGRWEGTADASGNATTPSYDGAGALTAVSFPDGRSESFAYHPDGKLASITEIGVDSLPQRSWSYSWAGDELARIDRPDGTAEEFFYGDARFPGYLTRIDEVGTDASRRVKKGWEYDAEGNVVRAWRGETVAGPTGDAPGPGAVEVWGLAFDDPVAPSTTMVTDPLGQVATYQVEREPQSGKTRVTSISGDCPACGLGPNVQLFYDDPAHRMLPTRMIDGRGTTTAMSYDDNGRLISKTEALGTPLERTTTWTYGDPAFPAIATRIERPSTSAGAVRRTELTLDAAGNAVQQTLSGVEGGSAFSYTTTTTYNAAGRPLTIDPPGYGATDVTSFTYDPARGSLVALGRTDPLIGPTSFAHDPLNRRTSLTDPNGVAVETAYDVMDRVAARTRKGATAAGDLVTEHEYNAFGDLERTILPEGNVVEYEYDDAGRLVSIARGPTAGVLLERAVYQLDAAGNRAKEQLQRWTGAAWETTAESDFVYSTRCLLEKIVRAPGSPEEALIEYGYDCDGNLEAVWDANHDSASDPPTRTFVYDALDRVTAISSQWNGAGGGTAVTAYGYDVRNNLTSITDPEGNTTVYTYSDRDRMTGRSSPVTATSSFAYNEHGKLVSETDGRGITTQRSLDALDRVTFLDTPENSLDTSYTYDDPGIPFSKGRLSAIARNGTSVGYAYDRFGRVTSEGALGFSYDKNGNRTGIIYPGGVTATYGHDFADREQTLGFHDGTTTTNLVTDAAYLPFGPLTNLALGNGLTEVRAFDRRYLPARISVGSLLDWEYGLDAVGNVLAISDNLNPAGSRTYGYQDAHYFLTSASGPWGDLAWTYDKTGHRLTEVRDGATSNYSYVPSATGGNSPKLTQVTDSTGAATRFFYDAAGNQIYRARASSKTRLSFDALQRLGQLLTDAPDSVATRTNLSYDGRGFLTQAELTPFPGRPATVSTRPTYSAGGFLMHKATSETLEADDPREGASASSDSYVFYFGERPVATFSRETVIDAGGGSTESSVLSFLGVDHLGTPVLATDSGGAATWVGGLEPFGGDYAGAGEAGVFLRFPGQWDDGAWGGEAPGSGFYYNVHRWYEPATGRYFRSDPLGFRSGLRLYDYARANPLRWIDRLGLQSTPPPAPTRDPFVPPFDPEFPSGPWGTRPDPECCDEDEIADAMDNVQEKLETLASGGVPSGTMGGAVMSGHFCQDDGWCQPEGPSAADPFDPFISPDIKDPCVVFCIRVHEWFHYADTRWWSLHWDDATYSDFIEGPAYGLEGACLSSFAAGN